MQEDNSYLKKELCLELLRVEDAVHILHHMETLWCEPKPGSDPPEYLFSNRDDLATHVHRLFLEPGNDFYVMGQDAFIRHTTNVSPAGRFSFDVFSKQIHRELKMCATKVYCEAECK